MLSTGAKNEKDKHSRCFSNECYGFYRYAKKAAKDNFKAKTQ